MDISKKEFEEFVKKEFPGKEYKWEFDGSSGFFYVQAGTGKYSADELHYEFYEGQVRLHIEGDNWWRLRQELYNLLHDHSELQGAVWNKRQNCQWILKTDKKDLFKKFCKIRDIIEPELVKLEQGARDARATLRSNNVDFSQKRIQDIFNLDLDIPEYQRIYCWEEEQVLTLLNDIESFTTEYYYLGNIILCKNNEKLDIVDGQQRLVTLAIIRYILLNEEPNLLSCSFESIEAQQQVINNGKIISDYLTDKNRAKAIEKIKKNINNIIMGVLIIENNNLDLSFTFFNNSNSRGKQLTDYDLLKPHHLRFIPVDYEAQQELYAAQWDKMIKSYIISTDDDENPEARIEADYICVFELYLYRLRRWSRWILPSNSERFVYKEFKTAPFIDEIPPFGEKFNYHEPIQGGQHFFEYVDHFVQKFRDFSTSSTENKKINVYKILCDNFTGYSDKWYRHVMEALIFCYYLKFENRFIYEASLSIVRYISQIRFENGRAYEPTIIKHALESGIVLMIEQATSPTFFLAEIENEIKKLNRIDNIEGIRESFYNKCKSVSEELSKYCISKSFRNKYFDTRYESITPKQH